MAAYSIIGLIGVVWYVTAAIRLLGWNAFEAGARIRWALGTYEIPSGFLFFEYFCIVTPLVAFALIVTGQKSGE